MRGQKLELSEDNFGRKFKVPNNHLKIDPDFDQKGAPDVEYQ